MSIYKTIEEIKSKKNIYIIMQISAGAFFCKVIPRNKITYLFELFNDYMGFSSRHPVFLDNMYHHSLEGLKEKIQIFVKDDNDVVRAPNYLDQCCFLCGRSLTKEDISDNNAFYQSCLQHKVAAQLETEKYFMQNPDYTKWSKE